MPQLSANLRKAAVFIRSLDTETATTLLAQLSSQEAQALRTAIRSLGPLDPEEQADVAAEFRSPRPLATQAANDGVELQISSSPTHPPSSMSAAARVAVSASKRFEFLDQAPIEALVPYLAREHAQTIAVVLSHLPARRAVDVLAGLPEKLQAETLERLAVLGDTDPESVVVLETELAAWLASRANGSGGKYPAANPVAAILAAADPLTRSELTKNLRTRNAALAGRLEPGTARRNRRASPTPNISDQAAIFADRVARSAPAAPRRADLKRPRVPLTAKSPAPQPQPLPSVEFDELVRLDNRTLAAVLSEVDAQVLVLALAGSTDEFVDRICRQMPARTARSFRRLIRKLGPTRLSDVESAQRAVATVAARFLAASLPNCAATPS